MSHFEIGNVVVHKSLGSQPLVVIRTDAPYPVSSISPRNVGIQVRYGNVTQESGTYFTDHTFLAEEIETPIESIEREADIFKALNTKKNEVNEELRRSEPTSPSGIGHLN